MFVAFVAAASAYLASDVAFEASDIALVASVSDLLLPPLSLTFHQQCFHLPVQHWQIGMLD